MLHQNSELTGPYSSFRLSCSSRYHSTQKNELTGMPYLLCREPVAIVATTRQGRSPAHSDVERSSLLLTQHLSVCDCAL